MEANSTLSDAACAKIAELVAPAFEEILSSMPVSSLSSVADMVANGTKSVSETGADSCPRLFS